MQTRESRTTRLARWRSNLIPAEVAHRIAARFCIGLAIALPGPAADAAAPQPRPAIRADELARRIHARVNAERGRHRLASLRFDPALAQVAQLHSRDMSERGYFSHDTPEGEDFGRRYRRARYTCAIRIGNTIHGGAENLALNHLYARITVVNGVSRYDWNAAEAIVRSVVDGWMKSPGHRANILTPHWKNEGIGVFIGPDMKVLVTQNFC